eukprot:CAMPEP_0198535884 /NCGR_PEP_ID=MMETSP1462-20131121/39952_1 /TAXON_ID=1333877 /ORGANISM="Brandtodinium nutriculum, Strain RCC3387" /LENGTH=159 /DNA_ID=CAMNT_0044265831 /DNA_START=105 /DNA_END=584 /DNA_ORIENTATION=-
MGSMISSPSPAAVARMYIEGTHGSLPEIDYDAIENLLAPEVTLLQEQNTANGWEAIKPMFQGWSSIVEGHSSITIHSIADAGNRVALAHWETNYDVKSGQTWYGTSVDISGKQMRGFTVFASFHLNHEGKIARIVQRSDDVVRKLGIEEAVYEDRKAKA